MLNNQLKIKIKAIIARRAGKAYGLLTYDEVKVHTDQIIKEMKVLKQLTKL